MRTLIFLSIAQLFFLTASALAQTDVAPAASHPAVAGNSDSPQDPAVLLTPMQQGEPADAALINDMCQLKERKVNVYRLQNAAANDVAESVNQWLQGKLKSNKATVRGFICNAPVIIVPDPVTNSLIVSVASDFAETADLDAMIKELDLAPRQIAVAAVIKKTVGGQTTVLTSPSIIMLENTQGSITVSTPEGELTIELTARIVNPTGQVQPPRTANRPTGQDSDGSK
jgi:type II secretory pathway component GspD/PulD (secretin)